MSPVDEPRAAARAPAASTGPGDAGSSAPAARVRCNTDPSEQIGTRIFRKNGRIIGYSSLFGPPRPQANLPSCVTFLYARVGAHGRVAATGTYQVRAGGEWRRFDRVVRRDVESTKMRLVVPERILDKEPAKLKITVRAERAGTKSLVLSAQ